MEKNELDIFRNDWLFELKSEKCDDEISSEGEAASKKTGGSSLNCDSNDQLVDPKTFKPDPDINSKEKVFTSESCGSSPNCLKLMKSDQNEEAEKKFPAFDIANNYLKFNVNDCRYCNTQNETKFKCDQTPINCKCNLNNNNNKKNKKHRHNITRNVDEPLLYDKKRKYTKFDRELYFKKHFDSFPQSSGISNLTDAKKENLVDLLIADIDEITCIPFFDIDLPKEIAVKIFQWLSIKDLSHCCCVNSKWKILAEDDLIWFDLCETLDVDKGGACVADRQHWNQYVKECMLERRRIQGKWKERCCEVRDLGNSESIYILILLF